MDGSTGGAQQQAPVDGLQLPANAVMETVGRWVTRYPDAAWLDLLAQRASRDRCTAAELVARVRAGQVRDADVHPTDLAHLAWLQATVATTPDQLRTAFLLFRRAVRHRSRPEVAQRVWNTWVQVAALVGESDEAAETASDLAHPDTWWAVRTDLANPFLHPDAPDRDTWLDRFGQPFVAGGVAPLRLLADEAASPFDRLATAAAPDRDGPLVSVVMPVFNPTPSLRTAVASVLAQTWRNLELVLVDDASTTGTEHLDAVAGLDPRVRLVRAERNGGAYAARNRGLAVARGELVTFQDADDYAHAQRLQQQAEAILADEATVASVSRSVRATDQLAITNIGYRLIAANLSSLMVRREQVLRRLGGFDAVRRGADTEFRDRVRRVFGTAALHRIDHPLAVVQLTPSSLSRGEMGSIHRHTAREAYIAAAHGWHDATASRTRDPHVQPPARAPFPAPAHVSGHTAEAAVADVVLLAPVEAGAFGGVGPLARALVQAGHRVAVKEFVGPEATVHRLRGVGPELGRLLAEGRVRWLLPTEPVTTALAVMHDPQALLTMPAPVLASVSAEQHLLIAPPAPTRPLVHAAQQQLTRVTGRDASWLPPTEDARAALVAAGARTLPPALWHVAAAPARPWRGVGHPVVGLVSPRLLPHTVPDDERLLPLDARTLLWAYGPYPARVADRPVTRIRADRRAWPQFLSRLSLFLAPDATLSRPVLDCWAAGVLVVAHARARALMGGSALYVGDEQHPDLDTLLERLADDPAAGAAAVAAASSRSRTSTSPSAVGTTLAAIITILEAG